MIVDCHVHLLPDRVRADLDSICAADPWFGACHAGPRARVAGVDDVLAEMDAAEVDRAVCFTWPFADPALCAEANDWLAAAVGRSGGRLVGFGVVNPARPGAVEEARRCAGLGLRGLGELNADAQGWSLEDEAVLEPLARVSAEESLTWTLHASEPVGHAYPGKGSATPDRIGRLAAAHADVAIIAAHLGGGLPLYGHMPEVREACRANLWFDTAAAPFLYTSQAHGAVVAAVGADRLLFGSDFPLLGMRRCADHVQDARLGDAETAAVMGGNVAALLEIT